MTNIARSVRFDVPHFETKDPSILPLTRHTVFNGFGNVATEQVTFMGGRLTHIKYDGASIRFGRDIEGKPFFETARSGPMYNPLDIIHHTGRKYVGHPRYESIMTMAREYVKLAYNLFDFMTYLDQCPGITVPKNTKLFAEVLHKGFQDKETGKFVHTAYPNLPDFQTNIAVWNVETADGTDITCDSNWSVFEYANDFPVLDTLINEFANAKGINFIEERFYSQEFDISDLMEEPDMMKKIGERFLKVHEGVLTLYGPDYEGIVFHAPISKITSPEFRERIKK